MLKIIKHLKARDKIFALLSLIFICIGVYFDLSLPDYMANITKLVQTEGSSINEILLSGLKMLGFATGSLLTSIAVGFLVSKIAANLSRTLRQEAYSKTMSFSKEEISKFSIPSLITRSTNDITQIQTFVTLGLQATIKAPILAIFAISKILDTSLEWSIATGVAVLFMMSIFATFITIALPRMSKIQKLTDDINRVSRESITGVRPVRAYNAENYQEEKFSKINDTLTKQNLFVNRTFAFLQPSMMFNMMCLTLAIYVIGAILINNAGLNDRLDIFSEMIVFSNYAVQVIMAFIMLAISFVMLPRAEISAKRLNEIFSTQTKITYGTKNSSNSKGNIEFKNVSFKYPDAEEYTLENISFTAKRGETVAFIGSTGSGKSTLIDLIPRFYDPTSGEILIDDIDIKEYSKEGLVSKIGYVSQKAVIFSDTVSQNIAYGAKENLDLILKSSEIAMAHEFVSNMDDNYSSLLSQGGTNVSGGQKQRLSIARAVYKQPEIYIFDDSFSALDYKTDRILRKNLKDNFKDVTKLIVAQRVGTILDADKIIVLDDGKIDSIGTHKELLKTSEIYKEIASSQLSKEEMENA